MKKLDDVVCLRGRAVVEHNYEIESHVHFGPATALCGSLKSAPASPWEPAVVSSRAPDRPQLAELAAP